MDALELLAGLDPDKLVEAHGSARGAHCLGCRKGFSREWFADKVHLVIACFASLKARDATF